MPLTDARNRSLFEIAQTEMTVETHLNSGRADIRDAAKLRSADTSHYLFAAFLIAVLYYIMIARAEDGMSDGDRNLTNPAPSVRRLPIDRRTRTTLRTVPSRVRTLLAFPRNRALVAGGDDWPGAITPPPLNNNTTHHNHNGPGPLGPHTPLPHPPPSPFRFDDHRPYRFAEDMGPLPPGALVGRLGDSLIPKGDPMEARLQEMLRYNMDKYANSNLDTLHISRRVRELLSIHNIGQRLFAKYVLGLSQGTVSELLSKPKPWDKLTEKGRDSYRKMHAWACDEHAVMLLKSLIPKKGTSLNLIFT